MHKNRRFPALLGVFLLVVGAAPLVIQDTQFQHLLIMLLLYATLSQSWNLIGGYAGQVSFGHAAFFGLGAYGSLALLRNWGLTPWVGMLIGALAAVFLAVVIAAPVFRLKGHYFAISTFAIAEVIRELFLSWEWVDGAIGLEAPVLEPGLASFMFYKTKLPYHFIVLGFFSLVMFLVYRIDRSRMGYYFRAIKQSLQHNMDTAQALGVNSARYKLYALMISAFCTAICGAFYAQYILHIEPATVLSLDISIKIVLVTVLGGVGTLWGPLLGAALLIPLQEYSRIWLGGTGRGIDLIVLGGLIVIICIFEPNGIVGWVKRFTRQGRKD
ncbi:MAG: branched-chain amino acid ABC transporter permease [Desulfobacterales bacterium]|nr:branched-chain amino acid ABC transporter permease [Desulfobacterales bacterium]